MKPTRTIKKLTNGDNVTIVALGDSLTAGWMTHKGYVDFLQEKLAQSYPQAKITFVKAGLPGDTAQNGRNRLRTEGLDYNPDCVLIQFALNDAFCGYSPTQFRASISIMIEDIKFDSDADIILLTSSYLGENAENNFVEEFYQQLEGLAISYNIPIAKTHTHWQNKIKDGIAFESLLLHDGVHPTISGYALMAEAIMELFV
ncbi:MAG: GDSL-type esterase/lipase family protein [Deltaproteobacteria bacterium]